MNMVEGSDVLLVDDDKEDLVTYPPDIQKNICTLLLLMLKHPGTHLYPFMIRIKIKGQIRFGLQSPFEKN
jgi:hypothetical protein